MKFARLKIFLRHIERELSDWDSVEKIRLNYFFEGGWFDEHETVISDPTVVDQLQSTRDSNQAWRQPRSKTVFFPVAELDAVLTVQCASSPKQRTSDKISRQITDCLEAATHEFNSTYDDLTGLYNRKTFDKFLESEIQRADAQIHIQTDEPQRTDPTGALAVLAFDIDHFKQINDTFTHPYGDVVLRFFGRRIAKICADLAPQYNDRVRFYPARPSGEEFLILLAGTFSAKEQGRIAETVRQEIEFRALPDENEWGQNEIEFGSPEDVSLPPESKRKITVSIGVASVRVPFPGDGPKKISATLKTQADIALYRAKAAGRNRVVSFREILARYGRILQQHPETKIVAIDIGEKVHVREGQEFHVHHPMFAGDTEFRFSDGRTEKVLGTYPEVPCGSIEVFDAQPEIAFCNIRNNSLPGPFPVGSVLRAIELGEIDHHLGHRTGTDKGLSRLEDVEAHVKQMADSGTPDVWVLNFLNAEAISTEQGSGYANRVLATLVRELRRRLAHGPFIAQLRKTAVAVVAREGAPLDRSVLGPAVRAVKTTFQSGVRIGVGVFSGQEAQDFYSQAGVPPDSTSALDLAWYATLDNHRNDDGVAPFRSSTAQSALTRRGQPISEVEGYYADFERLGLLNADVENRMGLHYWSAKQFEKSADAWTRALGYEPDEAGIWINAAIGQYALKNYGRAVELYRRGLAKLGPDEELTAGYMLWIAHIACVAYRNEAVRDSLAEAQDLVDRVAEREDSLPDSDRKRLAVLKKFIAAHSEPANG